jgi:hypothetical protein
MGQKSLYFTRTFTYIVIFSDSETYILQASNEGSILEVFENLHIYLNTSAVNIAINPNASCSFIILFSCNFINIIIQC